MCLQVMLGTSLPTLVLKSLCYISRALRKHCQRRLCSRSGLPADEVAHHAPHQCPLGGEETVDRSGPFAPRS